MKSIENAKKKANRRYGANIWGEANASFVKRETAPGQHGARKKKMTDYGQQLYAKQKLKTSYGNISEKQFAKYYDEAIRRRGDAAENLIGILESRLDNLVYRAKFVPTVFAARQFVNHNHVLVNGKKVNIPSYMVKAGDVIRKFDGQEVSSVEDIYSYISYAKAQNKIDVTVEIMSDGIIQTLKLNLGA